jgi:hypothetical protein
MLSLVRLAPQRVSQVPQLIFQHMPSPLTPKSLTVAFTRFFTLSSGLHHIRQTGRSHPFVSRGRTGFTYVMAYAFVARGFADADCSTLRSFDYMCYE